MPQLRPKHSKVKILNTSAAAVAAKTSSQVFFLVWDISFTISVSLLQSQSVSHLISCPTLRDPMDCSPQGSSILSWDFPGKKTRVSSHSILQGIFLTTDQTCVSCIAGGFFTVWATRGARNFLVGMTPNATLVPYFLFPYQSVEVGMLSASDLHWNYSWSLYCQMQHFSPVLMSPMFSATLDGFPPFWSSPNDFHLEASFQVLFLFLGFLIISVIFSENSGNRDSSSFIFKVQCLAQYLVPGGCNYPFSSQFSVLGHDMQLIFSFSEVHCPICLGKVTAYPAPGVDNDLFNQIM